MKKALLWFRNDLRTTDHAAIQAAVEDGFALLPVFIWDEKQFNDTNFGFPRIGKYRSAFIQQSLDDLQHLLQKSGGDLVIRKGSVKATILDLAQEVGTATVFCSEAYTTYEIQQLRELENAGISILAYHTSSLIHPADLPMDLEKLPDVFTSFRKKVEKYTSVREVIETPSVVSFVEQCWALASENPRMNTNVRFDQRAAVEFRGGTKAAWERINHYFWESESLAEYKETRNGLIGADYSSKLSPWLAAGSISPREVYHEVRRFESRVKKNQSTYWLIFELLWRDYFQFVALKFGDRLFWPSGIKGETPVDWRFDKKKFEQWCNGETGQDFVDANMRELKLTGFMSNRGRQNVASYLTKDLKIDWRAGAAWFEHLLIDHDPCSNYGNWQYVAGVGNDPRENRYFNLHKQAERYDPERRYRDLWLED